MRQVLRGPAALPSGASRQTTLWEGAEGSCADRQPSLQLRVGGGGVETSGILEFPGTGIHICRPHSTLFLFLNIPNTDNALKYYLFINSFESNFIFCTGFFITFEKYSSLEGHKKTRSSSTFAAFKLLRQQEVRM